MNNITKAIALWLCFATSASAEEFGRIEAKVNGEARIWYTVALQRGGKTDATATFGTRRVGFANTWSLQIQGHPRPSFTSNDVLSINLFSTGEVEPGTFTTGTEVMYLPTGMRPPIWTSGEGEGNASISFDVLAPEGEIGRAAGTFSSKVCIQETMTSEPDPTRCQQIAGRFDTQVLIEE